MNILDLAQHKYFPSVCKACVEIPAASSVKYEIDKETGLLKCDRILYSAVHYPLNYGFIPQTLCPDGDPADVLIITRYPLLPMTLVEVRLIGVLNLIDNNEDDDKFLAVNIHDPFYSHLTDYQEPSLIAKIREIEEFFKTYKNLEQKVVQIGHWHDHKHASDLLQNAHQAYRDRQIS